MASRCILKSLGYHPAIPPVRVDRIDRQREHLIVGVRRLILFLAILEMAIGQMDDPVAAEERIRIEEEASESACTEYLACLFLLLEDDERFKTLVRQSVQSPFLASPLWPLGVS